MGLWGRSQAIGNVIEFLFANVAVFMGRFPHKNKPYDAPQNGKSTWQEGQFENWIFNDKTGKLETETFKI